MRFKRSPMVVLCSVALVLAGCGDDPVAPPEPEPDPTVSASWSGSIDGSTTINLVLNEAVDREVTGSGNIIATATTIVLTVSSGTHVFPNLSLVLAAEGFESINITGTVTANRIDATLNGSGFTGETVILVKQ